jgi:predicted transcriptional regulator of viral defense system
MNANVLLLHLRFNMNNFLKQLQLNFRDQLFMDNDVKLFFHNKTSNAINCLLTYHVKKGNIVRFKKGVYSLLSVDNRVGFSKFKLANYLNEKSYVSFESALSHHGLIPEAVYETTSACFSGKRKIFKNRMGVFSCNGHELRLQNALSQSKKLL